MKISKLNKIINIFKKKIINRSCQNINKKQKITILIKISRSKKMEIIVQAILKNKNVLLLTQHLSTIYPTFNLFHNKIFYTIND